MAFQSVPDCAQVNIIYSQNSVVMQNSFYGFHPGGYSLGDLQALADDIDTAVPILWLPRQTVDATYLRTEVRGLANENDLVAEADAGSAVGDDAFGGLPNSVTCAIKKSSGLTGRSARGRVYWIGMPKDKLEAADENTIDTTFVAALVTAVDGIRTNIESVGTWEAVLVSRFLDGEKRTVGEKFDWVATSSVNNIVDTQRGRLPK